MFRKSLKAKVSALVLLVAFLLTSQAVYVSFKLHESMIDDSYKEFA